MGAAPLAEVVELPARPLVDASVLEATRLALEAAGRLDSPAGRNVLVLADRLDHSLKDTGSSVAAMSKQHLTALAEVLKDAPQAADEVDELEARRARRHG